MLFCSVHPDQKPMTQLTHSLLCHLSVQLLKTPWTAAWDRLVRVLLRLEHRSGTSSKHSSLLQQVFEAAAASEQMCVVVPQRPAAAAAAATAAQAAAPAEGTAAAAVAGGGSKEGSRLTSAVAQQEAAAMAEGPAAVAAVAAAAVVPGSSEAEGQEPQLCITAREFEVVSECEALLCAAKRPAVSYCSCSGAVASDSRSALSC